MTLATVTLTPKYLNQLAEPNSKSCKNLNRTSKRIRLGNWLTSLNGQCWIKKNSDTSARVIVNLIQNSTKSDKDIIHKTLNVFFYRFPKPYIPTFYSLNFLKHYLENQFNPFDFIVIIYSKIPNKDFRKIMDSTTEKNETIYTLMLKFEHPELCWKLFQLDPFTLRKKIANERENFPDINLRIERLLNRKVVEENSKYLQNDDSHLWIIEEKSLQQTLLEKCIQSSPEDTFNIFLPYAKDLLFTSIKEKNAFGENLIHRLAYKCSVNFQQIIDFLQGERKLLDDLFAEKNVCTQTPLEIAFLNKNHIFITYLLKTNPKLFKIKDFLEETIIHFAAQKADLNFLFELDLNLITPLFLEENLLGQSPFYFALKRNPFITFINTWEIAEKHIIKELKKKDPATGKTMLHTISKDLFLGFIPFILKTKKELLFPLLSIEDGRKRTIIHYLFEQIAKEEKITDIWKLFPIFKRLDCQFTREWEETLLKEDSEGLCAIDLCLKSPLQPAMCDFFSNNKTELVRKRLDMLIEANRSPFVFGNEGRNTNEKIIWQIIAKKFPTEFYSILFLLQQDQKQFECLLLSIARCDCEIALERFKLIQANLGKNKLILSLRLMKLEHHPFYNALNNQSTNLVNYFITLDPELPLIYSIAFPKIFEKLSDPLKLEFIQPFPELLKIVKSYSLADLINPHSKTQLIILDLEPLFVISKEKIIRDWLRFAGLRLASKSLKELRDKFPYREVIERLRKFYANMFFLIDYKHIRCETIDSAIMQEASKLDNLELLTFFDAINFEDKESPYYYNPKNIKKEGEFENVYTTLQPYEARNALVRMFKIMDENIPFIGAPKEPRNLPGYYRQIKTLQKVIVYKLKQIELNKEEPLSGTENRQKIFQINDAVITLAIAATFCAGRWMSDALLVSNLLTGINHLTLGNNLLKILAKSRLAILDRFRSSQYDGDIHALNTMIYHIGKAMGIPGHELVIEPLRTYIDPAILLLNFQKEYRPSYIISVVMEALYEERLFRDQFIDWAKENCGDWKKNEYSARIEKISNQPSWLNLKEKIRSIKFLADPNQEKEYCHFLSYLHSLPEKKRQKLISESKNDPQGIFNLLEYRLRKAFISESQVDKISKMKSLIPIVQFFKHLLLKFIKGKASMEDCLLEFRKYSIIQEIKRFFQENEIIFHTGYLENKLLPLIGTEESQAVLQEALVNFVERQRAEDYVHEEACKITDKGGEKQYTFNEDCIIAMLIKFHILKPLAGEEAYD